MSVSCSVNADGREFDAEHACDYVPMSCEERAGLAEYGNVNASDAS